MDRKLIAETRDKLSGPKNHNFAKKLSPESIAKREETKKRSRGSHNIIYKYINECDVEKFK